MQDKFLFKSDYLVKSYTGYYQTLVLNSNKCFNFVIDDCEMNIMQREIQRESMEFDVVIVGAGPAGLSAACRIMQLANDIEQTLTVCVVEKGSEVGSHILSGAILDTKSLDELFPDWHERQAPITTPVNQDNFYYLNSKDKSIQLPSCAVPHTMHNQGNYVVSMGNVCRWLADQAEQLGVEIFPGFSAQAVLYQGDHVAGIITGDMGLDANGEEKDSFVAGMELRAKYTIFAEGCRGHLGKQLIDKFELSQGKTPQHYGIGFKEIWDIPAEHHTPGLVVHSAGWPLDNDTGGGGFLYHGDNNQVYVGMIIDLNYQNPYLSPFDEFQRYKHHPVIGQHLQGGKRVSYGARAISKGGFQSLPKQSMPGALLIGCDAGTINFAKIKGNHTAMKSGLLAAESIVEALAAGNEGGDDLVSYQEKFKQSWLYQELYNARNFAPALHKFGTFWGGAFNTLNHNIFAGKLPFNIKDTSHDYQKMLLARTVNKITYPKPDNILSFDKLSSVYLSNTNHEENQPCHLKLQEPTIPIVVNLAKYAEPAVRYCPAGVYEIEEHEQKPRFVINAQNCIHCKTCDIKDPSQNITWLPPEGGGGPNYPNM